MIGGVIQNHRDCALSQLWGVLAWSGHGLIFSRNKPCDRAGRFSMFRDCGAVADAL
jgi:hypothetical protein